MADRDVSEHAPPAELTPVKRALLAVEDMRRRLDAAEARPHEPIAIVGMACRFPGHADDPDRYWQLLRDGVDAVGDVPADRWDVDALYDPDPDAPLKTYTRAGAFLDHVATFDPMFFGISPREAAKMDPQQRLLLEVCWEALERAGMAPAELNGTHTGVFVGQCGSEYGDISGNSLRGGATEMDAFFGTGVAPSVTAGRISFALGLQGPAMTIDTACSSSLVGVHLACQSLRSGESDVALAGGVNLILGPWVTIYMSKARALSPTGRCRTFDASADGYVRGEGCGVVVLKRLSDAIAAGDSILAMVRGTALNHDGRSGGLTVPNGQAQQTLIGAALADAGIESKDVSYLEAHGTGTPLGDPIEMRAIDAAYGRDRDEPLLVGSVKSNIGHLEAAAGVAGLIKVVLSLQHDAIPAHLHFREPSPHIDWEHLGARIPTELTPWPEHQTGRVAAISAFGFSGTNAHVVVSEAPVLADRAAERPERPLQVLTLSARSESALAEVAGEVAGVLHRQPDLALPDVAHTLNTGRNQFSHRVAVVAASGQDAAARLERYAATEASAGVATGVTSSLPPPKVAFLFTGQGSQYVDMGRELHTVEPTFRAAVDECDALLRDHLPVPLLDVMYAAAGATSAIDDTTYTQPALFALEYALARMWASWGVEPDMVIGHSIGGYVAAHLAGVLTLPDALALVAARGRVMGALPAGGSMAAVFADEATVAAAIGRAGARVSIAALNGPQSTVVSGPSPEVDALVAALAAVGVKSRALTTSHAFHSSLMEPALAEFERVASQVPFASPRRKLLVSDLTGQLAGDDVAGAAYWTRHIRDAVRFADGMTTLGENGCNVFLEIGPAPVLAAMGQRCVPDPHATWLSSLQPRRAELEQVLITLSELWARGVTVDWNGFDRGLPRRKLALPTYRFQRSRHWVAAPHDSRVASTAGGLHPLLGTSLDSALRTLQFESTFSLHEPSFNADRAWRGATTFSGGVAAEIALAAGAASFEAGARRRVEDVVVREQAAVGADQAWILQTVVVPGGRSSADVTIHGRPRAPGSYWQELATATVSVPGAAPVVPRVDPEAEQTWRAPVDVDERAAAWHEQGLELGARARAVRQLWASGPDDLWARLELPEGAGPYTLYPPLLDECALLLGRPGEVTGIERIEALLVASAAAPAWCRLRRSGTGGEIRFYDAEGTLVASCDGVAVAPLPDALPPRRDWCLEVAWEAGPAPADETAVDDRTDDWIVIGDPCGGPDRIDLALFAAEDLELARGALTERLRGGGVTHVVVATEPSAGGLPAAVARSVAEVVNVVRLLTDETWRLELAAPPRLWLVTRGAVDAGGTTPSPDQAALWGVLKSVAGELPQFFGGLLDLDPPGTDDWDRARRIIAGGGDGWLAWRGADLYRARVQPLTLDRPNRHVGLSATGALLITGAFGALGRETARWAIRQGGRHLILAARSPVPPRPQWPALAATDPAAARVAIIEELEALGATVEVATIDVADRAELDAFLAGRRAAGAPPITSVFHAAGVLRDRSVLQLDADDITAVLAPKVQGTLNLDDALASEPVEHFVLFSSAASALGSPGQANYAAANSFLDAFAQVRRAAGRPALAVNWGPWDAGMAARDDLAQRRDRTGIHAIPVPAGFDLLGSFMAAGIPNAIVLPVDPARVSMVLAAAGHDAGEHAAGSADRAAEILAAPAEERLALVERALRDQIGVVLGMSGNDVDLTVGLMDLGLDSLTIVELGGKLGAQLGLALNPREFFEEPSVQRLARSLLGALEQRGGQAASAERASGTDPVPVRRRVYVLATPGCPVGSLAPWFADAGDVVVDEGLADDAEALERLAAEPGTVFVHVARHPFTAIGRAECAQREAEERWATANGNLIDLAERVGPARCVVVRFEDLVAAPDDVVERLDERLGRRFAMDDAGRDRLDPSEANAWMHMELAQRPGRSVRVVADELGYDVSWPRPGRGGPPPPPPSPPPAAPPVPAWPEAAPPVVPISRELALEVSSGQERSLFVDDLQPGLAVYNLPTAVRLDGHLDVPALESAVSEIVRRHEVLRTNFEVVEGRYVQVVAKPVPVFLGFEDLRAVPAGQREAAVKDRITVEVSRPFDLQSDLKVRGLLLQTDDDVHVLVTTMHHIASDGTSIAVFYAELAALYEASVRGVAPTLAPLAIQYADYAAWQRELLASDAVTDQLDYWAERLGGELPVLDVPTDRPRTRARTFGSGTVAIDLPDDLVAGIRAGGRAAGVTPFMFVLGTYIATLARWSGQDDLVVGTALANRQAETVSLMGLFAETLAIRVPVDHEASFSDLLRDVKRAALGAMAHHDVPFERVVERVKPRRDLSRSPIFQTMLVYNKESRPLVAIDGFAVDLLDLNAGATELDLSVRVIERPTGTTALFEYSSDLFDADTIQRFVASWCALLAAAVTDPSASVASLALLTDTDRRMLLEDLGHSAVDVLAGLPSERSTIHGLVSATAAASPGAVAVRMGAETLTYGELEDRANRLAHHLRGLGVGAGELVGISMERSVTMVVALLGVLKAGAAYLPLDPGFPADRLAFMVDDAGVRVVLTSGSGAESRYPGTTAVDVVGEWSQIVGAGAPLDQSAGALAYVIYTSGSTGTPKGVEIEHRNAVNFLLSMQREPGLAPGDVVLGLATLSFDISVLEIFLPLVVGAEVVIASRDDAMDGERLAALIRSSGATMVQATPTTWSMLFDGGWRGDPSVTVLCGGEAMSIELAQRLVSSCGAVWNVFGPTETTVWSTVFRVTQDHLRGTTVPIGRPIAGMVCRVFDAAGVPVPVGVPGELAIGGRGVARGYLRRPELTAERFITDPFEPDLRLYRTGDLARWRPDGTLEYLGRLDHQVKVRGHRIELGEVEAALRSHPLVQDAVVVARGADQAARLIAYVIATEPSDLPTGSDLRHWLQRRQPEYMIPSSFVPIDRFPMTPTRKIDRKALPLPTAALPEEEAIEPRDGLETTLGEIWADVLGRPSVGVNQNFFDLGGYSLLATRVFALIEERTGHRLPISALFEAPTVAELADAIRSDGWRNEWTSMVPIQREGIAVPFFYVAPYQISVLQFANLGDDLAPDRPLYGFQPQGLDGRLPAHTSIEQMAGHYITEMKSVQPHGPYAVGGHCAGAWVAFEMARQLEAGGDQLQAVVLVDQGPPGAEAPAIRPVSYLVNRMRFYLRDGRFRHALMWKLRIATGRHLVRRVGPPTARYVEEVRAIHREAFRHYQGGTLGHDLVLIRSAESLALADKSWYVQWADRTEGTFRIESVPGTHANLLERPYVDALAAKIRAALDRG